MKKIAFLGSKTLGLHLLQALHTPKDQWRIIHPNDTQDGRSELSRFQAFAREQHLDLLIASGPAAADEMLLDFSPDIAFVCGWYWLLKPKVLERVPLGFWGAHNSLLPKYRGGSPLVWAIIRGERTVGSTVFRFTPGMDDGPILHQVQTDLAKHDHIADALDRIEEALVTELPAKWRALLSGEAALTEQNHVEATYCGQRIPEDGRIRWNDSATRICDFVRAQSRPYPGAFTTVGDLKVIVWKADEDPREWCGVPGQVLARENSHVVVACGGYTAVQLSQVEIEGESVHPFKAFPSIGLRLD